MSSMKGITPVIAIILLLLITISMVGFAFVWFTRVSEIATSQTQQQLQAQLDTTAQKIKIDVIYKGTSASDPMKVIIRNTGSQSIKLKSIVGLKNGADIRCQTALTDTPPSQLFATAADSAVLSVSSVITCIDTASATKYCTGGEQIKITAPGNSDTLAC